MPENWKNKKIRASGVRKKTNGRKYRPAVTEMKPGGKPRATREEKSQS